ncbi:MAG TPA: glycosyltransferase family 39 protein, partial [Steroidobacteraceae bacterium]|nr:glycosyltransferase family 39 protein [Steroidobacteraceae bacterium]
MQLNSRGLSSLFEDTQPRARADRKTLAVLVLIVAVGALVRFWGLGNVGLHGDEKTMALPAVHLLEYGTPEMPSGFLYPRAVAQLYLMAGSMRAFGRSEWALRLPSAICGVLLIGLAWLAGRRFLEPRWNLAMTAAVALLPGFIEDAQTARMYVFLVTGVTAFMALLFAWERTGRSRYLVFAVLEMAVSLQFHTLSIFAAWM